jgi:hypothetical protein
MGCIAQRRQETGPQSCQSGSAVQRRRGDVPCKSLSIAERFSAASVSP